MARGRSRSGTWLRQLLLLILVGAIAFLVFRLRGPALISVRGDALAPYVSEGDILLARRNRSETFLHGEIVVVDGPIRTGNRLEDLIRQFRSRRQEEPFRPSMGEPVLRVVLGVPGDEVRWNSESVEVTSPGSDSSDVYILPVIHQVLVQSDESIVLPRNAYFLVALQPGRSDSRATGAVPENAIRFRVQSIIWPRERQGLLEPLYPAVYR